MSLGVDGGVLLTSGEYSMGLAAVRSLGRGGVPVTVCSSKLNAMSFSSKYCRKHFTYPHPDIDPDGFIQALKKKAESGDYAMVMPGGPDVLEVLSERRGEIEEYAKVAMPSKKVMRVANNKALNNQAAEKAGVPTPKTFYGLTHENKDEIIERIPTPYVIKPYVGAGSKGLTYVDKPGDLEEAYEKVVGKHGPCIIQEKIRGQRYSFSCLSNFKGQPRRICLYKTLRMHPLSGGPNSAVITEDNPDIIDHGLKMVRAIKWGGVASLQFLVDEEDGKPKLIDFNSRFFGSMQAPISAGVDYPLQFYRMMLEGDIEEDYGFTVGLKSRCMIIQDLRHTMTVLRGNAPPGYPKNKLQALRDYLSLWDYKYDYIICKDDPLPAAREINNILGRKTR